MELKRLKGLVIATISLFLILLAVFFLGKLGFGLSEEIINWATPGISWLAGGLCLYLANWDVVPERHRVAWIAFGLGEFAYGLGDLWCPILEYSNLWLNLPDIYDLFYVLFYICFSVGFINFTLHFHKSAKDVYKNLVKCGLGTILISSVLLLVLYRIAMPQFVFLPTYTFWVSFAYVVFDIFLVIWALFNMGLVLECAREIKVIWGFMVALFGIAMLFDISFMIFLNEYLPEIGASVIDIGWMSMHLFVALSALHYGECIQKIDLACKLQSM